MITLSTPQPRQILRLALPLLIGGGCCVLLVQRIADMDVALISAALAEVSLWQWLFALTATWISFQAIGRYDAIWHLVQQTGVPSTAARRAGMQAIAVAQFLGFGAVTASLARWRALPMLTVWRTTQLSIAVTATFTLCWAIYAVLAVASLDTPAMAFPLPLAIAIAGGIIAATLWARPYLAPKLTNTNIGQLLGWTGVDLTFAALALFVLMPDTLALAFPAIIAAYVLALGAGLVANTPGGAGAFDLTLLTLLPTTDAEALVAAILAFRIVYYVIPAATGLICLARPNTARSVTANDPAAHGLARQTGDIVRYGLTQWHIGTAPFVAANLGAAEVGGFPAFRAHALRRAKIPVLYNCTPRLALIARTAGWDVRRTMMEAMIRPTRWSLEGAHRQSLRRKLRKADKAGVVVSAAQGDLPLSDMSRIARVWRLNSGGEHGFSMGHYCPHSIETQRVFLIYTDKTLRGFVSFHAGRNDWVLDLIRYDADLPCGAVHAAVVAAIEAAKAENIPHLSLACAPDPRYMPQQLTDRRAGLTQFKRSFGPIWVPRYYAAPTTVAMWVSGAIITWGIHRPLANLAWRVALNLKLIMQIYQERNRP